MHWSDLPLNPSRRMLRQFAGLLIAVFSALAVSHGLGARALDTKEILDLTAVGLGVLGLILPIVLRPVFIASVVLAFPIGWVVSRVILILLFGLAITPVALVFRARGRDALDRRRPVGATTYWKVKPAPRDLASYFRQS